MAAEVAEDLSKSQKRELKWERKQAKLRAAAQAAGTAYVAPTKEAKDAATDKMGKRKKRKLAALEQGAAADSSAPTSDQQSHVSPEQSNTATAAAAAADSLLSGDVTAEQSKAHKKAAKKAKKAAAASNIPQSPGAPLTNGTPQAAKLNKKEKKAATEATEPADSQPASSVPASKKQKKSAAAQPAQTPSTPHGRVKAHQQAVLASVGDQELAKSGKPVQKDLYQEHPSVSAMSVEEVTKHRADRDTAVTGADIRPVPQFDQAGSMLLHFCHVRAATLGTAGAYALRSCALC